MGEINWHMSALKVVIFMPRKCLDCLSSVGNPAAKRQLPFGPDRHLLYTTAMPPPRDSRGNDIAM